LNRILEEWSRIVSIKRWKFMKVENLVNFESENPPSEYEVYIFTDIQ